MKSFAVAALAAVASAQVGKISVDPQTRSMVDEHGRAILFHGVNAVYKVSPFLPTITGPWTPQDSLNAQDIEYMKEWGFNFVRLGVMWEAVEQQEGVYDDSYLDQVEVLINNLGAAGIYTLVDMHQDVFARSICGEGFPDFYAKQVVGEKPVCISRWIDPLLAGLYSKIGLCEPISSFDFQYDANGDPLIPDCQTVEFYKFYETSNSIVAFQSLYENKQNLRDKFIAYWDKTSSRFGNNPYVVGFDPLNEPFPGNFLRDPKLLMPGRADREHLAPMYASI